MRRSRKPRAVSLPSVPRFSILKAQCRDPRLRVVLEMLESCELTRELSAEELSEPVNLSASRLRQLFKQELGVSPFQAQRLRRMEVACELILSTFLRVKEVRNKVGMPDASHFNRCFRQVFGEAPTELRKQGADSASQCQNHRKNSGNSGEN